MAVSNADLGGAGPTWYVMDTTRGIKPLIYQNRKNPNFVAMTADTDPNVFSKGEFVYGVDSRANVGFGFWQMAYASNQELTSDNIWKAINAINTCKGDHGRPLGLRATTIVVPQSLDRQINKLLTAELLGNGGVTETNDMKGRLTPLVSSWL